jgi:hypothetical protein
MLNQHVRSERGAERWTGLFACHYEILSVQIARQNNTPSPVVLPIALAISWRKARNQKLEIRNKFEKEKIQIFKHPMR